MRSFAALRMTIRCEKKGEKKAAAPPSFPSHLQTTGCHPERRHEAKDLAKEKVACPIIILYPIVNWDK
jgi:hypothetical protein